MVFDMAQEVQDPPSSTLLVQKYILVRRNLKSTNLVRPITRASVVVTCLNSQHEKLRNPLK
jgi:hypothetical protein